MATDQMKCEMKIMKIKANSYKKKFKSIDNQMFQNIKEKLNGNQDGIEKAKLCWQEACNKEIAISQELWGKGENWHKGQELNGTLELQRNPQGG